eukprot:1194604-Prorocentrum_minimum.AAC.7
MSGTPGLVSGSGLRSRSRVKIPGQDPGSRSRVKIPGQDPGSRSRVNGYSTVMRLRLQVRAVHQAQ